MASDTETFSIEGPDGSTETITLPAALVDALTEGDEAHETVLGDIVVQSLASQAHHLAHHSEGDLPPALADAEETMMDLFEERFGMTFGEMTGHSH